MQNSLLSNNNYGSGDNNEKITTFKKPGGKYLKPGWEYSRWEISGGEFSGGGGGQNSPRGSLIVRDFLGEDFPVGSFTDTIRDIVQEDHYL